MRIKKLFDIAICTCCAFSIQVLMFTVLPENLTPSLNETTLQQTFILTLLGSLAVNMFRFNFMHSWVYHAISYLLLMSIIIGIGSFAFHLIPVDLKVYASVSIVGLFVYMGTYLLVLHKNKVDADIINQSLKKKQEDIHGKYH